MRLRLTSLAIFVQFLGIATAAVYQELRDTSNEARNESVCLTRACNSTATRIIMDMDITVNPCHDFYEFACGGFIKRHLPSGAVITSGRLMARNKFKYQLKNFLEADYKVEDLKTVKLMKTLYKACMDEVSIESRGVGRLKSLIRMLGGWPILDGASWKESNFDWMATPAAWTRVGMPPVSFMNIGIEPDKDNKLQRVLFISPPTWIIKSYHLDKGFNGTAAIRAYYTLMVEVAVSLGADRKIAQKELKEALMFQITLSESIAVANSGILRLTLKTLIERYPGVNWRDTFARMYSPTQTIGDDDVVVVYSPTSIDNVIALVSKTPKRVLANFAMFQIIPSNMRIMNKQTIVKLNAYELTRDNYVKRDKRWVYCTSVVIDRMPIGVTYMYAKKLLKPKTKVKFEDMIQNIRQEFQANIDKISFLDNATRTSAKTKESAIISIVGHPNELLDADALETYYEDLNLFDDYTVNMYFLSKFNYDKQVSEFRKPINYINSTAQLNFLLNSIAYASPMLNRIAFAPSSLQEILFNPEQPHYINFGTTGTTIGHEITHLFDSSGRLYATNDINNGVGIFTMASDLEFRERIKCFQNQYGNYTEPIINRDVNGYVTVDENIADNASVKRAYYAYVNTMSGKAPEKQLHGLNYTPTQMFWIAYANKNCEKRTPSYSQYMWRRDRHTTGRFRVIGPLSNSEEFAKDFNCRLGSAMNPPKKCSMW